MRRILLLLACLPTLCSSQSTQTRQFTCGPVQFEVDAGVIVVLYHGHEWTPDIAKLPIRAEDCPNGTARKECGAHPGAACLACIREWLPVAWDGLNEILYFTASTGPKRILLGYDLRNEQIARVLESSGPAFAADGAVSPTGRYLALMTHADCATCCPSSNLTIVDTQTRKMDSVQDDSVSITGVRWTGPSMLTYSAEICKPATVSAPRQVTRSVNVAKP